MSTRVPSQRTAAPFSTGTPTQRIARSSPSALTIRFFISQPPPSAIILSNVACTFARSSGGRPRRILKGSGRLSTIKSEDFVKLGRPIALGSRKERPAAVIRKKQACRRYNSLRSRSLSHLPGHQIECPDRRFSLSASLLLRAFEIIAPRVARDLSCEGGMHPGRVALGFKAGSADCWRHVRVSHHFRKRRRNWRRGTRKRGST
jgi:hypothetical protein